MNLPVPHSAAPTTIFSVMSALAAEHGAINLSQGFPDFPVDGALSELLFEASRDGHNQYAPMAGLPALREAIAADWQRRRSVTIDPETDVTVTPGATYAIYTAFKTVLEPGDEAIILEPAYDSYKPNIEMCGAKPVPVPLLSPSFVPDWERIRAAVTPRTKAIIVNTPHNPTGAVWTQGDWTALAAIVRGTQIIVLSDEVYEQLTFDGSVHHSILQHEELRARAFALFSFGKVHHNTGWKMGYCIAPPALTAAFRRLHQFIAFSVNTPTQHAIAAYLKRPNHYPARQLLQGKRDLMVELLNANGFSIHQPAAGSYFQLAGYSGISDLPDLEFARWLTKEHGVAVIPVSAFYSSGRDDKLVRFCFAKREETLRAAGERLKSIVNSR